MEHIVVFNLREKKEEKKVQIKRTLLLRKNDKILFFMHPICASMLKFNLLMICLSSLVLLCFYTLKII